jgi:hypothetical protein
MSDAPDVNGEFEVAGLPEIDGAVWTISKREGPTPEYPNTWWDYNVEDLGFWLTLTVGSDEWVLPTYTSLSDGTIANTAGELYLMRLNDIRGAVAETTDIHPVPKA